MEQFSVLISLYHKEKPEYLRQSLDSIINQTVPPNEIIMVEDGPLTPDLYSVLEEYQHNYKFFKRIPLSKNVGLGSALNEGLKHCTYNLVARMDTDDISLSDRFEKQIAFFSKHSDIDVLSGSSLSFKNNINNVLSKKSLPLTHDKIAKAIKLISPIGHPNCMFKKDKVLLAGGYKHLYLFEDYYLWVRMLANHCKFANLPDVLIYFRTSDDMYRRRGGWKYAKSEIHLYNEMRNLKIINHLEMTLILLLRIPIRLLPNKCREGIYNLYRNFKNKQNND